MKLVLDTNVVLDWLAFAAPSLASFREQVASGRVQVITDMIATEELRSVLPRRQLKFDPMRQQAIFEQYCAHTVLAEPGGRPLPPNFPRCKDPDDDPFLELAYRSTASALVTKDKLVLRLRRRMRKFGFEVMTVQQMIAALDAAHGATSSGTSSPERD
jgi:uncharacterized protein